MLKKRFPPVEELKVTELLFPQDALGRNAVLLCQRRLQAGVGLRTELHAGQMQIFNLKNNKNRKISHLMMFVLLT